MARVFIEGWESGGLENWDLNSSCTVVAAQEGMTGSYCLEATGINDYCYKNLLSSYASLYFAFKYRPTSDGASQCILHLFDSGGTAIASIIRNKTSHFLEARRGAYNGTLLATGTSALSAGVTYLIEVYYAPLNTGGSIQVKVNGNAVEINYSGDTTNGLENIQRVSLGQPSDSMFYMDDLVIDDASWIGNTKIQGIVPTGVGTTTQWDPSAGSNYACVDEKPYSDTDYVSTNVTDEIDTYAAGDLSGSVASIKCVQIQARCSKDGVPTPTQLQLAVRSGGTNYFSSSKTVPTVFGVPAWAIWEDNPADSADWEEADVNAMEIGMKAVA